MKKSSSNLTKSLSKLINTRKLNREILLYLSYFPVSLTVWLLNKLVFGEEISTKIHEFSKNFETIISYQEGPWIFFLKSFILILTIYSFIIVIQSLTNIIVGSALYLLLVALAGLASGAGFGGGLISYLWSNNAVILIAGQIEWIAGALLISAIPTFNKIRKNPLILGVVLLIIATFLNSIILTV